MGEWKEAPIFKMPKVNSGELQSGQSPQHNPRSSPPIVGEIGLPEELRQVHRKFALSAPAGTPAGEVFQDEKPEELRDSDWKGAYFKNLLAGYPREGEPSQQSSNRQPLE
ncbi:unnamed protein product [Calypogeia fissa]